MEKPSAGTIAAVAAVGVGAWLLLRRPDRLPPSLTPPTITEDPTLTRAAARIIADAIYAALYGSGGWGTGSVDEDEAAVIAALAHAQNDADVLLIADEYGLRGWLWTGDYDLPGAITRYLSATDIAEINAGFARRGIQIRF